MPLQQFDERKVAVGGVLSNAIEVHNVLVTVFTATDGDARIDVLTVCNYDSIAHLVYADLYDGTDAHDLGGLSVAASDGAGTLSTLVDWIAYFRPAAQPFIYVPRGWVLRFAINEDAVDLGISVSFQGGTF